jgi:hypothetical protein
MAATGGVRVLIREALRRLLATDGRRCLTGTVLTAEEVDSRIATNVSAAAGDPRGPRAYHLVSGHAL